MPNPSSYAPAPVDRPPLCSGRIARCNSRSACARALGDSIELGCGRCVRSAFRLVARVGLWLEDLASRAPRRRIVEPVPALLEETFPTSRRERAPDSFRFALRTMPFPDHRCRRVSHPRGGSAVHLTSRLSRRRVCAEHSSQRTLAVGRSARRPWLRRPPSRRREREAEPASLVRRSDQLGDVFRLRRIGGCWESDVDVAVDSITSHPSAVQAGAIIPGRRAVRRPRSCIWRGFTSPIAPIEYASRTRAALAAPNSLIAALDPHRSA